MTKKRLVVLSLSLCVLAFRAQAEDSGEIRLELVDFAGSDLIGAYRPMSVWLSESRPASLKTLPAGLEKPLFAILALSSAGDRAYHVILDDREAGSVLYVDRQGRGDMSKALPADWEYYAPKTDESRYGGSYIDLPFGNGTMSVYVGMHKFDKNDPKRPNAGNMLVYYRDYAYKGHIEVGGKDVIARLDDEFLRGDFRGMEGKPESGVTLLLDLDGDGLFYRGAGEYIDVRKPFKYKGYEYRVSDMSVSGDSFRIVSSDGSAPKIRASKAVDDDRAKTFTAVDIDGKKITFPGDYKGKLVLLDFWATWCAPCMRDLPSVVAAYSKYSSKGFEILGVSLDTSDAANLKKSLKANAMPWRQICDRKAWDADIVTLYGVKSIPGAFLVDGDTGLILAEGGQLSAAKLDKVLTAAMRKKFGG